MCFCHTCKFTHYWCNLVERMQHAEDCGERFPAERKRAQLFCYPSNQGECLNVNKSVQVFEICLCDTDVCLRVSECMVCTRGVVSLSLSFFVLTKVQTLSPRHLTPGGERRG